MAGALEAGSTFAGHRIERLLGVGGMGEVYLATSSSAGASSRSRSSRRRSPATISFRAPLRARGAARPRGSTTRTSSPCTSAGEHDGRLYIEHGLHRRARPRAPCCAERGALHPGHAAVIVAQVAGALDAAAERAWSTATSSRATSSSAAGERAARLPRRLRALQARRFDQRPDPDRPLGGHDRLRLARSSSRPPRSISAPTSTRSGPCSTRRSPGRFPIRARARSTR